MFFAGHVYLLYAEERLKTELEAVRVVGGRSWHSEGCVLRRDNKDRE